MTVLRGTGDLLPQCHPLASFSELVFGEAGAEALVSGAWGG